MTDNQKDFIKNIRDYFGIQLRDLDERKILFFLSEYENGKPKEKPKVVKTGKKIVKYVYVPRGYSKPSGLSDDELKKECESYCLEYKVNKNAFAPYRNKKSIYGNRASTSIVKHRGRFSQMMVKKGATLNQLALFFRVSRTTALYYVDPTNRKLNKNGKQRTEAIS